jgi:hypothetical protein
MAVKVTDMNLMSWVRRLLDCWVHAIGQTRTGGYCDVAKPIEALLQCFTANESKIRRDVPNALYVYGHTVG